MKKRTYRFGFMFISVCIGVAGAAGALEIQQPVPDLAVQDAAGKLVKLSDFKGRVVVLEWTNPGCPYVRKHYDSGNMPGTQKAALAQGVVWLTVSSTAKGHGDFRAPADLQTWLGEKGAAPSRVLMDSDGKLGRAFDARTTPHMYVVDTQGRLAYAGAIDSVPTPRVEDLAKATNYVKAAVPEVVAGKPVGTPVTKPYGCSVKYADG